MKTKTLEKEGTAQQLNALWIQLRGVVDTFIAEYFFQVLPASFPILSLLQESNLRRSRESRKLPQVSVSDLQFYRMLCFLLQMIYLELWWYMGCILHTFISKTVVGESGEKQLSNGDCTTERNCGFHIWYAKTMSSSRGARLILRSLTRRRRKRERHLKM